MLQVLWLKGISSDLLPIITSQISTVEIVYNETGYNEQPDITSRFGAKSGLVDALI